MSSQNKNKKVNLIVAVLIMICGMGLGGWLVLKSQIGKADIAQQITGLFKPQNSQNIDDKNKDSDNDGLTDWQEAIYQTDANNPDSDSDGYLDGEEVFSGYDPLVKAPNDKISLTAIWPRPEPGSFVGVNLTEELIKAISESVKNTNENPFASEGTLDLQANDIVQNALNIALSKSPQFTLIPTISDSEIKISADNSSENVKNYVKEVTGVLDNYLGSGANFSQTSLEALEDAIDSNNFKELNPYIDAYQKSFQQIKEIAAPTDWQEIHKKTLTMLLGSANIFQAVSLLQEDPLRAALALQEYQTISDTGQEVLDQGLNLIPGQNQ